MFWLPRNPQFWLLTGTGLSPFLNVINEPGPLKFLNFQVLASLLHPEKGQHVSTTATFPFFLYPGAA